MNGLIATTIIDPAGAADHVMQSLGHDGLTIGLLVVVVLCMISVLCLSSWLKHRFRETVDPALIRVFNRRIVGWLTIYTLLGLTTLFGATATVVFFGLVAFWALREFITMTPTRRADHRTLFWVFLIFLPLQYVLAAFSGNPKLFIVFAVVIPVYASLFIAGRIAFDGDAERFLERTAKIHFGLLICVYALSHAPALLYLDLVYYDPPESSALVAMQDPQPDGSSIRSPILKEGLLPVQDPSTGSDVSKDVESSMPQPASDSDKEMTHYSHWNKSTARLLFFLVFMVQVSDFFQFFWDRLYGKNVIAGSVNRTKTWEGLVGAAICCGAFGMILQLVTRITPFTPYAAAIMAMVISVMGISGVMTMSAIKRDRGVSDYGTLVQGHAGVLDRIDAICFAAPIFYHLTRFFLVRDVG